MNAVILGFDSIGWPLHDLNEPEAQDQDSKNSDDKDGHFP
jgi:hypothetical protein